MRCHRKGAEPAALEAWKANASDDWQPTYQSLKNPEKRALQQALLDEQGHLCCYCGRSIGLADSHIEHFRPQGQRPDLSLDFNNLLASCIREIKPGAPLHCGHAKGQAFDEDRHLSPLDPTCEERFDYLLDGTIQPKDERATYMAALLKLDITPLRMRRKEVLDRVFDPEFIESATADELRTLAEALRSPDATGHFESFGHVAARYAEQQLDGTAR